MDTKKLVCVLTDEDKENYKEESSRLESALWSVKRRAKRLLLEINGLQLDREGLVFARRFSLQETDEVDEYGGYRLREVTDEQAVNNDLLDVTCKVEEVKETRGAVLNRKKVAEDRLVELSQALRSGKEEREVECEWIPDHRDGISRLVRMDTYETIESRKLTEDEAQAAFSFDPAPRAMTACPVCPMRVGITGGVLDAHKDLNGLECVSTGLTTQQATTLGTRIAEFETRPDPLVIDQLRAEVVSASRGGLAIVPDAGEAEDDDDIAEDPFIDAEFNAAAFAVEDTEESPGNDAGSDERDEEATHSRAEASASILDDSSASLNVAQLLGTLLAGMGKYIADLYPADAKQLLVNAGPHAEAVRHHLLEDQIGTELKTTTRRTLNAWHG